MNAQSALPTFRLAAGTSIAQARPQPAPQVSVDSPAPSVMTDLTQVRAATVEPTAGLRRAEQMMIHQGVRMLFVVTDLPSVAGLITSNDVAGDRPMRLVHERQLHFDELCVGDVMTPLDQLDAIDLDKLAGATVGNLIATLKRFGRNHLLVVETLAGGVRRIRGVVSRAQVERQLGAPVVVTQIANSFSEIERALA